MLVRLNIWWDSPHGLLPPDSEVEVDAETGVRLCTDGHADVVRSAPVEAAVTVPAERAVAVTRKRRKKKAKR
jgi:hypothetical protein